MAEKTKSLTQRITGYWPVAAILAGIILAGISCYYIDRTIVNTWVAAGVAAAISVTPVLMIIKRGDDDMVWYLFKAGSMWFFMITLLLCSVLALNCHMADTGTLHSEQVTVESKHSETRYRTRRVRRHYTGRGEPYNIYKVKVRFESGAVKEFTVPLSHYNSARPGKQYTVDVARGLLGLPVLHRHNDNE